MPGESPEAGQRLISLQIESKEVPFATLALNRFTQTRVVPEDGVGGLVTLKLDHVKVPKAVAQLAKQVHRHWIRLYAFRGERNRGRPGEMAAAEGGGRDRRGGDENGERRRGEGADLTPEHREERRKERETLEEELKQTTRCLNNLKQLGVAVFMYADEHEGSLPAAETLIGTPIDPAKPLPRICDVLAPTLGYSTNALPTTLTVFRCTKDKTGCFEREGSSYEWSAPLNGRQLGSRWERTIMMYDYENFHTGPNGGTKYFLFGDGHVAK